MADLLALSQRRDRRGLEEYVNVVWGMARTSQLWVDEPPMAIPYTARTPRNCLRLCVKPVASSRMMKRIKHVIIGHFRPYLSAKLPKMSAPTERSIKVTVMPHVTEDGSSLNSAAISVTVSETVKKSKQHISSTDCLGLVDIVLTERIPHPTKEPGKKHQPLVSI